MMPIILFICGIMQVALFLLYYHFTKHLSFAMLGVMSGAGSLWYAMTDLLQDIEFSRSDKGGQEFISKWEGRRSQGCVLFAVAGFILFFMLLVLGK